MTGSSKPSNTISRSGTHIAMMIQGGRCDGSSCVNSPGIPKEYSNASGIPIISLVHRASVSTSCCVCMPGRQENIIF